MDEELLIVTSVVQSLRTYHEIFSLDNLLSEEDDEEEERIQFALQQLSYNVNKERSIPSRIRNFVEDTVLNSTDKEFQMHFRLTRQAFNATLEVLRPWLTSVSIVGRPTIEPEKQLLAVLWLLATPESYRSVGSRFDMGKSTLFDCFKRVIRGLNHIAPNIISWPRGHRAVQVEQEFHQMASMRGVIGAVDGTYVPIKAPQENPHAYINRKCFYGVTLQAVCDSQRKFTDCYTGWPSSVSDTRIFKNSDLYRRCQTNLEQYFDEDHYILGDKAYPIMKWCIPPYINRGNLQQWQVHFNTSVAKTRQIIERAFALLFGRFRRLRYLDMNRMDLLPVTIIACCVLHNICLNAVDDLLHMYEDEGRPFVQGDDVEERLFGNGDNNREGQNFRNRLARDLMNRRRVRN